MTITLSRGGRPHNTAGLAYANEAPGGNSDRYTPISSAGGVQFAEESPNLQFADPDNDVESGGTPPEPKPVANGPIDKSTQRKNQDVNGRPEIQYADDIPDEERGLTEEELAAKADADAGKKKPEPKPASKPAEVDNGEFTDELLKSAERYGISAEEAKDFGTPAKLQRALAAQDKLIANLGRAKIDAQTPVTQPATKTPEAAPQAPVVTPDNLDELKVVLSDDMLGELTDEAKAVVVSLTDQFNDRLSKLASGTRNLAQTREAEVRAAKTERDARFNASMDKFFQGLPDEYRTIYGSGALNALKPDGPEAAARLEFVKDMHALANGEMSVGRSLPGDDELQQRALRMRHPDSIKAAARKELATELDERKKNALSRSGGATRREANPIDRAARKYGAAFAAKFGDGDKNPEV